tara:strand:- start:339 stop:719 length:381 start_codon:yes stop_codon:yes gene_type:complete
LLVLYSLSTLAERDHSHVIPVGLGRWQFAEYVEQNLVPLFIVLCFKMNRDPLVVVDLAHHQRECLLFVMALDRFIDHNLPQILEFDDRDLWTPNPILFDCDGRHFTMFRSFVEPLDFERGALCGLP